MINVEFKKQLDDGSYLFCRDGTYFHVTESDIDDMKRLIVQARQNQITVKEIER